VHGVLSLARNCCLRFSHASRQRVIALVTADRYPTPVRWILEAMPLDARVSVDASEDLDASMPAPDCGCISTCTETWVPLDDFPVTADILRWAGVTVDPAGHRLIATSIGGPIGPIGKNDGISQVAGEARQSRGRGAKTTLAKVVWATECSGSGK